MPQTSPNASEERERQKPVTMAEMAKLAGVHSRTVSDVLKGTGRVAPATREKVLSIARELNYVPNAAARALATGRTEKVAVLSGPLNESFYANMAYILEKHLTSKGYEMTLLHTRRDVKDLMQATQVSLVDGVIVVGSNHFPEEFLRLRGSSARPCVLIDTARPNYADHITLDLRPAVEEVLQLMLAMQRRRIAYVANNRDEAAHTEVRMATYLTAMKKAGRVAEIIDVNTSMSPEARIKDIKHYISQAGCPDALLCQNDETAIYVYRALSEAGFRIPDDALLAGCDGLPYMEYFTPSLSSISLPLEDICVSAINFFQNRISDPSIPLQETIIQGKLVIRDSLLANVYGAFRVDSSVN